MNSTGLNIAGSSAATTMVADVLMWLTHWPLQPLNQDEAMALGGILISAAGLLVHFYQAKKGATAPATVPLPSLSGINQ